MLGWLYEAKDIFSHICQKYLSVVKTIMTHMDNIGCFFITSWTTE